MHGDMYTYGLPYAPAAAYPPRMYAPYAQTQQVPQASPYLAPPVLQRGASLHQLQRSGSSPALRAPAVAPAPHPKQQQQQQQQHASAAVFAALMGQPLLAPSPLSLRPSLSASSDSDKSMTSDDGRKKRRRRRRRRCRRHRKGAADASSSPRGSCTSQVFADWDSLTDATSSDSIFDRIQSNVRIGLSFHEQASVMFDVPRLSLSSASSEEADIDVDLDGLLSTDDEEDYDLEDDFEDDN